MRRRRWCCILLGVVVTVWRPVVTALVILIAVGAVASHDAHVAQHLQDRITFLEHACVPSDTGGGVAQCGQPTITDRVLEMRMEDLTRCVTNTAYTRDLIPQCIDDLGGH